MNFLNPAQTAPMGHILDANSSRPERQTAQSILRRRDVPLSPSPDTAVRQIKQLELHKSRGGVHTSHHAATQQSIFTLLFLNCSEVLTCER